MLALDDKRWETLRGGYRTPYNPAAALRKLESNDETETIWEEFWNELHHQGDVDQASYAVVPHLVRIQKVRMDLGWNFYSLISTIEIERHRNGNPAILKWLEPEYAAAWKEILEIGGRHIVTANTPELIQGILSVLSIAKGFRIYGEVICHYNEDELSLILNGED